VEDQADDWEKLKASPDELARKNSNCRRPKEARLAGRAVLSDQRDVEAGTNRREGRIIAVLAATSIAIPDARLAIAKMIS